MIRHSAFLLARKIYTLFPYPKIWAKLFNTMLPSSYISGKKTLLDRPESVVFSHSGKLMAISNSGNYNIGLFARDEARDSHYSNIPCGVVSNATLLDYVHDSAFSSCGKYLISEARESHTIAMFQLNLEDNTKVTVKKLWSATGQKHKIYFPAGIAIHPSKNIIAVANRKEYGITLYQGNIYEENYNARPFQIITDENMHAHGLSAPHGFDFSPDGKYLVVAHKRFFKTENSKGESALSMFQLQDNNELNPNPVCIVPYGKTKLHLVAFNPTGDIVALVDSKYGIELYDWSDKEKTLTKRTKIPIFHIGEGPKGISFTRDGKQIAVTTEMNEILFFDFK